MHHYLCAASLTTVDIQMLCSPLMVLFSCNLSQLRVQSTKPSFASYKAMSFVPWQPSYGSYPIWVYRYLVCGWCCAVAFEGPPWKAHCRWVGRNMDVSDVTCDFAKASTVGFLEVVKRANFKPFLLLPLAINSALLTLLALFWVLSIHRLVPFC